MTLIKEMGVCKDNHIFTYALFFKIFMSLKDFEQIDERIYNKRIKDHFE